MTVSRILDKKGHRVFTIAESAPLREVVKDLAAHHVGVLVVTGADQQAVGVISERDVVRELAADEAAMDRPASAAMTGLVCKCSLDDTEGEVMEKMGKSGVRHLPVSHHGKLVGVISARDIIKLRIEKLNELMAEIMNEAVLKP